MDELETEERETPFPFILCIWKKPYFFHMNSRRFLVPVNATRMNGEWDSKERERAKKEWSLTLEKTLVDTRVACTVKLSLSHSNSLYTSHVHSSFSAFAFYLFFSRYMMKYPLFTRPHISFFLIHFFSWFSLSFLIYLLVCPMHTLLYVHVCAVYSV